MAGLELMVGAYENCIIGFKIEPLKSNPSELHLNQHFYSQVHSASVRALATNGKYLISAGSDYRLCLFDLETGLHIDEMVHRNGTIEWLKFNPKGDLLFCGNFEGDVIAFTANPLEPVKVMPNIHHGSVLSFSIHPEDTVALSIGTDKNLKLLDLQGDKTRSVLRLRNDPNFSGLRFHVEWNPDGQYFALSGQRAVDLVPLNETKRCRIPCFSQPVSLCWISRTEIAIGQIDGYLLIANVDNEIEPKKIWVCNSKLVALAFLGNHLATASEAGDICLWKVDGNDITVVGATTLDYTLTCMVMTDPNKHFQQPGPPMTVSTNYGEERTVEVADEDPLAKFSSISIDPITGIIQATEKFEDTAVAESVALEISSCK